MGKFDEDTRQWSGLKMELWIRRESSTVIRNALGR